jgi:CRISPR-associated protein Csd1
MILKRLYELAEREKLLTDPAFEEQPVPFVIKLGANGEYLGVDEWRGVLTLPSRKKDSPPKTKPDKGKALLIPKAHGNAANAGFARFFVDTLARVLPISDESKSLNSRQTFWEQINQAADQTDDAALRAVQAFGRHLQNDGDLAQRVRADVEAKEPGAGDRCTFAWHPDEGKTIVEKESVRNWYRRFFAALSGERQEAGPQGLCQITGEAGPLPTSHTTKISSVPGGLPQGVSVVSNDKVAFESYGLDKASNSGIGYRAADGYTRALNALIAGKLPDRPKSSLRVGNVLFLFWTREKTNLDDVMSLEDARPDQVALLIASAQRGKPNYGTEPRDFYCLCLSGNAARAIVRDYLEAPLPEVRANLSRWFDDLQIIDTYTNESTACFPLWMLASATVRDSDDLPPDLPTLLTMAALKGNRVPEHVLAACLRRIRVESGSQQFRPARMGLIKLILNRNASEGDLFMTENLDPEASGRSPGYACGRLLAFLARCQNPEKFGTEAQILQRYFGSASTAPRSVFPVLLRLNRHHLQKIRDEKPGFAFNLEKELEQRLEAFHKQDSRDPDFPALLSLPEQGRFALGFYHQRSEYRKQAAERKAAEQQAAP